MNANWSGVADPVEGWNEPGRGAIKPITDFAGLYDRATGQMPYQLPPRWIAAQGKIDPATVLDFSTSNDVVGGTFGYDPALNRSVVVSTGAVEAELKAVYPAPHLVAAELHAR